MKPQNFQEAVIYYSIIGIYLLFFLSSQFIAVPMIAWGLLAYLILDHFFLRPAKRSAVHIPIGVWVWVVAMLAILVALMVGLVNIDASLTRLIKSFINNFMRTWALLAVFPLIGCFQIRPQIVSRAICLLAVQTLIILPFAYIMMTAGVEMPLYTISILSKIGGFSDLYYEVALHAVENISGQSRLTMFAPWAPALACAATVHMWLASYEKNVVLRWLGIGANIILIIGSASRLGQLCLVVLPLVRFSLINLTRPMWLFGAAFAAFLASLQSSRIVTGLTDLKIYFDNQRSESSHVREVLARVALNRWTDAPIWGHAMKAPGSQATRDMPIGSHHTWIGVLFTHGLVGTTALLFAAAYTFIDLVIKSQASKVSQVSLMVFLTMIAFSFGENLETLAYMFWPGLVMLGIGLQEPDRVFTSASDEPPLPIATHS
ncbi:MAG: O-antigen ligase domain-containing protein [Cyanobacteria bacterium J06626_4]